MPQRPISLREANQNFSRLIAAVERGEAFSITRRGVEVARLSPSKPPKPEGADQSVQGGADGANPKVTARAAIPLTEAALAERMLRLESLVDKLLSALSSPRHR